jgi:hypothetical protein
MVKNQRWFPPARRPTQPELDVEICDVVSEHRFDVHLGPMTASRVQHGLHPRLVIPDLAGDSHSLNPQKKAQNQRCQGLLSCAAQKTFRSAAQYRND